MGQEAAPDTPLSPKTLLPAEPVRSADGRVTVLSSRAMEQYRTPVLAFVSRAREEFLRPVRMREGMEAFMLVVAIGNKRDGDTSVLSARMKFPGGDVYERIELPDPEAADLALFKHRIWLALYRSWLVGNAGGSEKVLERLPAWLAEGAVRRMDVATWPADVDRVLALWSRACLPTAPVLMARGDEAAAIEPALGAVLADYLMSTRTVASATAEDRKGNVSVLDTLIRDAVAGQEWSAGHIAALVTGADDAVALDTSLDLWLAVLGRRVLTPGLTTGGMVQRFSASLLIYPSDYGKLFDQRKPWVTFQELAAAGDDRRMRQAAAAHVARVQIAAVGRDRSLTDLAEAYAQFLRAVAAGKKPGEVTRLLMSAEAQRKGLEDRLKGGKMLRD